MIQGKKLSQEMIFFACGTIRETIAKGDIKT